MDDWLSEHLSDVHADSPPEQLPNPPDTQFLLPPGGGLDAVSDTPVVTASRLVHESLTMRLGRITDGCWKCVCLEWLWTLKDGS